MRGKSFALEAAIAATVLRRKIYFAWQGTILLRTL
jgi:hypothetical protein